VSHLLSGVSHLKKRLGGVSKDLAAAGAAAEDDGICIDEDRR
jgi:hypothetical protein